MSITDPISDMLTRIRNAVMARHDFVLVPASKTKLAIAELFKNEGFIQGYELIDGDTPKKSLKIRLYYHDRNDPAITGLKRVSSPGLRVYVRKGEIPRYFAGIGVSILSTSKGIMTGKDAWKNGIGGELLCYVW
ncbi:MAG: 30S ribosomal protein S8 [Chloroflexota bacterium]|jgi:small subunit ribosomal protein S8|tara:strand:- start:10438 stop:10839 length:402 start_codon:yes stop_codon:yes gene_type:complete